MKPSRTALAAVLSALLLTGAAAHATGPSTQIAQATDMQTLIDSIKGDHPPEQSTQPVPQRPPADDPLNEVLRQYNIREVPADPAARREEVLRRRTEQNITLAGIFERYGVPMPDREAAASQLHKALVDIAGRLPLPSDVRAIETQPPADADAIASQLGLVTAPATVPDLENNPAPTVEELIRALRLQ